MNASATGYYLLIGRQQHGPYSLEELRAGLVAGWAQTDHLVWGPGLGSWTLLAQVPGLGAPFPPASPPPPSAHVPGSRHPSPSRRRSLVLSGGCLLLAGLLGLLLAGGAAVRLGWLKVPLAGLGPGYEVAKPSSEPAPPWTEEARNDALPTPARFIGEVRREVSP